MTPTSPLAGLLTGLVDGLLIALLVMVVVYLTSRRRRTVTVVHPVAEDLPSKPEIGELPKAFTPLP
jgi:hypothetical protein